MGKLAHEMPGTCERSDANETYVIEKMSSFKALWKYITKKILGSMRDFWW